MEQDSLVQEAGVSAESEVFRCIESTTLRIVHENGRVSICEIARRAKLSEPQLGIDGCVEQVVNQLLDAYCLTLADMHGDTYVTIDETWTCCTENTSAAASQDDEDLLELSVAAYFEHDVYAQTYGEQFTKRM